MSRLPHSERSISLSCVLFAVASNPNTRRPTANAIKVASLIDFPCEDRDCAAAQKVAGTNSPKTPALKLLIRTAGTVRPKS